MDFLFGCRNFALTLRMRNGQPPSKATATPAGQAIGCRILGVCGSTTLVERNMRRLEFQDTENGKAGSFDDDDDDVMMMMTTMTMMNNRSKR